MSSTFVRLRFWSAVAVIVGSLPLIGHANITSTTPIRVFTNSNITVWDPSMAFDEVNKVFLVVYTYNDQGPWGLFLGEDGKAIGTPFLMNSAYAVFARVVAGNGRFFVSYFQQGKQRAQIVRYGPPRTVSSQILLADADFPYVTNGAAYDPNHDAFLATFVKNKQAFVVGLKSNNTTLTNVLQVTTTTSPNECRNQNGVLTANLEKFAQPEIAYDAGANRALVVGYRDPTSCFQPNGKKHGGIWSRLIAFDGNTLTNVNGMGWLVKSFFHEEPVVTFAASSSTFNTAWSHINPTTLKRQVLARAVGADGNPSGTSFTLLDSNLTNNSQYDDSFNQLSLEFNPDTAKLLLAMRGNDCCGVGWAPVFGLEVDDNNTSIGGIKEISQQNNRPARPYPALAYDKFTDKFLVAFKGPIRGDIYTALIAADGVGTPGGGGGPNPDPDPDPGPDPGPPPPPPGAKTLTISAQPTNGSITAAGITCGFAYAVDDCFQAYPAALTIPLTAVPRAGYRFAGWTGDSDCSDGKVVVSGPRTCSATFEPVGAVSGSSSPDPDLSSSGPRTLTISAQPTNGSITAAGISCGFAYATDDCSQTYPATLTIPMTAVPRAGYKFVSWTGHSDCSDGKVTMSGPRTCSANFAPLP
jgi:hypothetical protein